MEEVRDHGGETFVGVVVGQAVIEVFGIEVVVDDHHRRPGPAAFRGNNVNRHLAFWDAIDLERIRRYQIELAAIMPNARSRARALVALRQFLTYAYDAGWLTPEMSRHVVMPKFTIGDPHPVPTETVPKLLAALPKA